ncbi:hypothetical protein [Klebsiella phage 05F01]|nr:hypothetical protein [Klebsiella phage 05F01]
MNKLYWILLILSYIMLSYNTIESSIFGSMILISANTIVFYDCKRRENVRK